MRYLTLICVVNSRRFRAYAALGAIVFFCTTSAVSAQGQDQAKDQTKDQEPALRPPVTNPDDRLGGASIFGEALRLPTVASGRLTLPPLMAATTGVDAIGNGSTPKEFRSDRETPTQDMLEAGSERDPNWSPTTYQFAAANTFSNPRYFEDRMLERHGHERFPYLQPFVSGARFFGTVPMLPYLMTVTPPCECQYELGYFRPGNCVHPYIQRPPYQRDAVLVEAAAIAGASVAIP